MAHSYWNIRLAQCGRDIEELTLVTPGSPFHERRAVEQLARYFKRETHFDFVPYSAAAHDADTEAWLLPWHGSRPGCQYAAWSPNCSPGAAAFVRREGPQGAWALAWIWVHPYIRGRGVWRDAWAIWLKRYGQFQAEGPFTRAGEAFLRRMKAATVRASKINFVI